MLGIELTEKSSMKNILIGAKILSSYHIYVAHLNPRFL